MLYSYLIPVMGVSFHSTKIIMVEFMPHIHYSDI